MNSRQLVEAKTKDEPCAAQNSTTVETIGAD